ncbi:hypothetical protein [Geodermatophilus nigrescens]|uniref:hypothetical protein n=1 Tax=Geodermatophilus nigrescens TaxID=1070870 RepID=UPI0015880DCE|nr:hypothetical protein [Geodermatophilus nigrescens]
MRDTAPCTIALLVLSILLQRLGVPVTEEQAPVMVPVVLFLLAVGLRTGEFRFSLGNLRLLAVVWGAAAVCTLAQVVLGGMPSLFSLALIVVLYVVAAVAADITPAAVERVEKVFLGLMTFFAVVSIGQLASQYAGIPYEDRMLWFVPEGLLLVDYNTADPIAYGEAIYRSNGIVFLEPSFLSLFLGAAAALALWRRAHWLVITVLLVGMVPPLAGSGFVVLIPAVVVLAFTRSRRRNLLAIVPALAVAAVVAFLTPLGERYLDRSTEAGDSNTSSSIRLVQPYYELLPPSIEDPVSAAVGHGAGTANDHLEAEGLTAVTQPIIPKVAFEYGLLGVVGILGALLLMLGRGVRDRPWTLGLLVLYVYVNASFLQHTQVFITLFFICLMPAVARPAPPGDPDERRADDLVGAGTESSR